MDRHSEHIANPEGPPSSMGGTVRPTAPKRSFASRLFGYDIFLSFALGPPPRGTHSYASDLARRLRERDFSVFFSEDEAPPGEQLDSTLRTGLLSSKTLVVIANRGTLQDPRWVRKEVEEFRKNHPDRPVIPINVGGALQEPTLAESTQKWLSYKGNIWLDESEEAVAAGIASEQVAERLATAPARAKANVKWRWVRNGAIVVLVALAIGLGIAAKIAMDNANEAMRQRGIAERNEATAKEREKEAKEAAEAERRAKEGEEVQRKNAEEAAREARKQRDIANQQREVAEERFKIALSRQLATQALAVLNNRFDLALLLSVEANRAYRTFEASNALLSALTCNPHLTTFLRGHPDRVTSVAFSPDGSLLAAGTCDAFGDYFCKEGVIALWDTRSRKLARALFRGHINGISQVSFSPDGKLLASASQDGTIILWDVVNRQQKGKYHGAEPIVFSPNSAMLASAECTRWSGSGEKWIVTIKQATDVQSSRKLESESKAQITSIAFSPDGKTLAEGRIDGLISLWDLDDGGEPKRSFIGHQGRVSGLAFSPDGRVLISGGWDKVVAFWDTESVDVISKPKVEHQSGVLSIALDPTGRRLLSASRDNTVIVWDIESYRPVELYKGGMTTLDNVAFSPDGKTLAWGGHENTVAVWDLSLKHPLGEVVTRHKDRVWSVSFSRNGEMLASAGRHDGIHLWMVEQGKPGPYVLGESGYSVAFGPDGRTLAVAEGRSIRLWNAISGESLCAPLSGHGSRVVSLAFSHDGKLVASASHDHTVRLWDTILKQPAGRPLKGHNQPVNSVAFSPDSKILVSGGSDERVILWDITSRRPLGQPLVGHRDGVTSVAFSPNGRTLAVATMSVSVGTRIGRIFLWDLTTRTRSREPLAADGFRIDSVMFSPDGRLLAAGGDDGVILWNTDTYQQIGASLRAHRNRVLSVAFSPDSHKLASAGDDGLVILWDVSRNSWQMRACNLAGRDLSREEWARFLPETPYRRTCLPDVDEVAR